MNKDVIYIDVEDDITAIIGKVKSSKDKIVALVPPKRVGVLQSAVNLRLLSRAAKQGQKRLVLITNNSALSSLAASASIPVAKNLQSKPELAEVAALEIDDGEDIIDGSALAIGEHATQAAQKPGPEDEVAAAAATIALAEPPKRGEPLKKPSAKKTPKVPNFNRFRKKIIIILLLLFCLVGFLIWAIFVAPHAKVIVSAKTNTESISVPVSVGDGLETNAKNSTLKAVKAKESEDKSVEFNATGTKNIGEKASGTVEFSTNNITDLGRTIPAGTKLVSASGVEFTTDSSVTISTDNYNGAPTGVTAVDRGAKYNAASGGMNGAPNGISARLSGPTSGGTDKTVKVVTAGDVQAAKQKLVDGNTDAAKSRLQKTFTPNSKILEGSFDVGYSSVSSSPGVGEEAASGKGTLSSTINYKMYALEASEIGNFIDNYLKDQFDDKSDRRIYANGADKASTQDIVKSKDGAILTIVASAKVGPKLEEKAIKDLVRGKKFGDIQSAIQSIEGVENVDVKFTPFWLSTVPDDTKRISVQFKVNGTK